METIPPVAAQCANCGAALQGGYCSRCGQKHWGDHGWSLGHFIHELFHEFTHVDSSILGTFRALLKPGELTAQYLSGHRAAFVNPIRLYLLTMAVFFFFGASTDFSLEGMAQIGVASGLLRGIQQKAHAEGVPYHIAVEHYDTVFHQSFSLLIALGIVSSSLTLWLLMRKRDPWLAKHVVFAVHCYTFFFLVRLVVSGLMHLGQKARWLAGRQALDYATWVMVVAILTYLLLGMRRVYQEPWNKLIGKWLVLALVIFCGYAVALAGGTLIVVWTILKVPL